jgi:hypothetical protein
MKGNRRGDMHMSTIETTSSRQVRRSEGRQPDYVVRAKTGPGRQEWSTVGSAWKRDNGDGLTVKLNAMPIGSHWNGTLKLLPPYVEEDTADASDE